MYIFTTVPYRPVCRSKETGDHTYTLLLRSNEMRADAPAFIPTSAWKNEQKAPLILSSECDANQQSLGTRTRTRARQKNGSRSHRPRGKNTTHQGRESHAHACAGTADSHEVELKDNTSATNIRDDEGRRRNRRYKHDQSQVVDSAVTYNFARKLAKDIDAKEPHRKNANEPVVPVHMPRKNQRRQRQESGGNKQTRQNQIEAINEVQAPIVDSKSFPSLPILDSYSAPPEDIISISNSKGNWSTIANAGHANSETQRIQQLRECERIAERIRHEIETFTRMDVLGSNLNDCGKDSTQETMGEKENLSSNIYHVEEASADCHVATTAGVTGKLLDVEKLRQRWSKALEERREVPENERKIQAEQDDRCSDEIMAENHTFHSCCDSVDQSTDGGAEPFYEGSSGDANQNIAEIGSSWTELAHTHEYLITKEFPLHYAILANDEVAVRDLVSLPPETTLRDERVAIEKLQITAGCALRVPSSQLTSRFSVMQLAILLHRPNLLKILLSSANSRSLNYVTSTFALDDQDDQRRTPLMLACEFALDECIKVLLSYGPKMTLKHPTTGDCALHTACRHGDPSTVKLILGSLRDKDGTRSNASRDKNNARQRLLCSRNRRGETPMHVTCYMGRFDILEALLSSCSSATADKVLSVKDHVGHTPLLAAITKGASDIVMHLVTWRGNQRGTAPCMTDCPLTLAIKTKSMEIIHLLLECRSLSWFHSYDYTGALCKVICCFEDSCEDACTLISLLIEEGADPHTKMEGECIIGHSPLTLAAMKGCVKFVACILDTYPSTQRSKMRLLREDPFLRMQPSSYFMSIEAKEKEKVEQSLEDTLIKVLVCVTKDCDLSICHRQLGSCLAIFRRGAMIIDEIAFVKLFTGMRVQHCVSQFRATLAPDEVVFQGRYSHPTISDKINTSIPVISPYSRPSAQAWSLSLIKMDWVWRNVLSLEDIRCCWINEVLSSSVDEIKEKTADNDSDICLLIVDGHHLLVHKSILSKKSAKLEAAIRFEEMKNVGMGGSDCITEVSLDIPLQYLHFLVAHCYHGSIVTGLSPDLTECCQQLLDLYFLSVEYLCPSLALECEMRLLSSNPYKCYCWSCCERVEMKLEHELFCYYEVKVRGIYFHTINFFVSLVTHTPSSTIDFLQCSLYAKGPSKLLSVNNYLGVISSVQDFDLNPNDYAIIRKATAGFLDAPFEPLSALRAIVWKDTLLNFNRVLKTESYVSLCHSTLRHDEETRSAEYFECFGDQVGILLLRTVLDELASIPPEFMFISPATDPFQADPNLSIYQASER